MVVSFETTQDQELIPMGLISSIELYQIGQIGLLQPVHIVSYWADMSLCTVKMFISLQLAQLIQHLILNLLSWRSRKKYSIYFHVRQDLEL